MPFDFGGANEAQREAITTADGPVLITAGPGTGKTFTLVRRALHLIQEHGAKPEEIMIATFTEKAASELITRMTDAMSSAGIAVDVHDMWVGTFHSLCMRLIKEHLEHTRLKKNSRVLDAFDQQYMVFRSIKQFEEADPDGHIVEERRGPWYNAGVICSLAGNLSEELVDPSSLLGDGDPAIVAVGRIYQTYLAMLKEGNMLDFSSIQVEAYRLLHLNREILSQMRERIRYIMVDEYQDTNYIQEQIVFKLGGESKNICVVGDDDQGLYRFRGATIRNILEFADKFRDPECKVIKLDVNYRSEPDIVSFYNNWIATTDMPDRSFRWDKYRLDKRIRPHKEKTMTCPSVYRLGAQVDDYEWYEKVHALITKLKDSGKIEDYNQIAFLFSSVKHRYAQGLSDYLEANGIKVYAPRSGMYFQRDEVKLAIGCLMMVFPKSVESLENGKFERLSDAHSDYFIECAQAAGAKVATNKELRRWVSSYERAHRGLTQATDYNYSMLLYQMFRFEPFKNILDTDLNAGVFDTRPVRNLAMLTKIIAKYEHLHNVDVLTPKSIEADTEKLFDLYLRLLIDGGMEEYQDDSEYAPSGCVSFMTIHQSKGLEFPIVFVDSMYSKPINRPKNETLADIEARYFKRPSFEPRDDIKYFDFWRLFYTAFSRAQDLLVLTTREISKGTWPSPSFAFAKTYAALPSIESDAFDLSEFEFHTVKDVFVKKKFSFTSHISVYETCALQYKFYKELEFEPQRGNAAIFGRLVHETIEDIHKAALRREYDSITPDNIEAWMEANYSTLVKMERMYLAPIPRRAALDQVLRYAERQSGKWDAIVEAEVDVSLVQKDYIIEGKIDLIRGDGDTVEIVDFKSEQKPDVNAPDARLEHYKRQLYLYAHLVEQRTGRYVSRMHLYYTAEEDGVPQITVDRSPAAIEGAVRAFDDTVQKIMRRDYTHISKSPKTCGACDFRFYCDKVEQGGR